MEEKITPCGDNCAECPRYLAKSEDALQQAAELWYRIGWRDKIVSNEEIRCDGCTPDKKCTYQLVECIRSHHIQKCSECEKFPCKKIHAMLERSEAYCKRCKEVCTEQEYTQLEKAFFQKEENL